MEAGNHQRSYLQQYINNNSAPFDCQIRRLTSFDKINIFHNCQSKLQVEFNRLRAKYPEKNPKTTELEAHATIATEIFRRINSAAGIGSKQFDFHSLTILQAKIIADSVVKKHLPKKRRIEIITGYGRHAKDKRSYLQEALLDYFKNALGLSCEVHHENKGILIVS
jgi:hypothetical protein